MVLQEEPLSLSTSPLPAAFIAVWQWVALILAPLLLLRETLTKATAVIVLSVTAVDCVGGNLGDVA